jgi:hypothetical protein
MTSTSAPTAHSHSCCKTAEMKCRKKWNTMGPNCATIDEKRQTDGHTGHQGSNGLDLRCPILLERPRPVISYRSMGQYSSISRIPRLALLSLGSLLARAEYPSRVLQPGDTCRHCGQRGRWARQCPPKFKNRPYRQSSENSAAAVNKSATER